MEKIICSNCGSPNIKLIPAGVSKKTGKAYKAFFSCPDCKMAHNTNQEAKASEIGQISPKDASLEVVMERFDAIESQLGEMTAILLDLRNR